MKNIIRFLIILISISAISCTDDVKNREALSENAAPTLKSPASGLTMIFNKDNASDLATTLVWDDALYNGTATVVNYAIEIAKAGTNFASPSVAGTTTNRFKDFTIGELNSAALDGGFTPFVESQIDIRIKATVGTTGSVPQYSNKITIKLTPYPSWPNWAIIGSATPNGWNDPDTNLAYDLSTKKYSYTGPLSVGEYKFRLDDGWGTNFGDDGNDLKLDSNGANIPLTVAGNYKIVIDFVAKTYTITKL